MLIALVCILMGCHKEPMYSGVIINNFNDSIMFDVSGSGTPHKDNEVWYWKEKRPGELYNHGFEVRTLHGHRVSDTVWTGTLSTSLILTRGLTYHIEQQYGK